jgi:hypothetical protein
MAKHEPGGNKTIEMVGVKTIVKGRKRFLLEKHKQVMTMLQLSLLQRWVGE